MNPLDINPNIEPPKIEKQARAEDIFGKFKINQITNLWPTVSVIPTAVPKSFLEQFQLYASGGTRDLYFWGTNDAHWYHISLSN